MRRGRPKLDIPMTRVVITAHRADAIAWQRMIDQKTVKITTGELFGMLLERYVKRKD